MYSDDDGSFCVGEIYIMKHVILKISELTPPKRNAKIHTPEQIEHIKKSIGKYGFNDAIGIWGEKNIIVTGNGRVQALKEMGVEEVECVRLDHLTDDGRREYALTHNQTCMETGFDFDIVSLEMDDLKDFDFGEFGFDGILNGDDFSTDFKLPDTDKSQFQTLSFTLTNEQAEFIKTAMQKVKNDVFETFGNQNSNGNMLYEVVRQWDEQKKSN